MELAQGICLTIATLMACPWTPVALRDEGRGESVQHNGTQWDFAADNGTRPGAPTQFSSCICEAAVGGTRHAAIIVTQPFGEAPGACATQCKDMCPLFLSNASYKACLVVHTEDGTTGQNLELHHGMRPNIVDPQLPTLPKMQLKLELTDSDIENLEVHQPPSMRMVKHESYANTHLYAACTCTRQGEQILAGHKGYYGGLQVWGRTGCSRTTCSQACSLVGAGSGPGGCILAAMTKEEPSETPSQGPLGYETQPLTTSLQKYPNGPPRSSKQQGKVTPGYMTFGNVPQGNVTS